MLLRGLRLVEIDALIDLFVVDTVISDRRLDEAERYLQIACCLGSVPVVVPYFGDYHPYVPSGSREASSPVGGPVGEAEKRMFVHPRLFLDVALRQSPWQKVQVPSVRSETLDGRVPQADAKRAAHGSRSGARTRAREKLRYALYARRYPGSCPVSSVGRASPW